MNSLCMIIDILFLTLGLVGFILFAWWWKFLGQASLVYKSVTFLLLVSAIEHGYHLFFLDSLVVEKLHGSPMNLICEFSILSVFIIIVAQTIIRIIRLNKKAKLIKNKWKKKRPK